VKGKPPAGKGNGQGHSNKEKNRRKECFVWPSCEGAEKKKKKEAGGIWRKKLKGGTEGGNVTIGDERKSFADSDTNSKNQRQKGHKRLKEAINRTTDENYRNLKRGVPVGKKRGPLDVEPQVCKKVGKIPSGNRRLGVKAKGTLGKTMKKEGWELNHPWVRKGGRK